MTDPIYLDSTDLICFDPSHWQRDYLLQMSGEVVEKWLLTPRSPGLNLEISGNHPSELMILKHNPFRHDKTLDQTKIGSICRRKTKMIIAVFDRVENIVGKGEIARTSNFFFSYDVFKRLLSQTCQKVSLC